MNNRDWWTCYAMKKYGGSFVVSLAKLAGQADRVNLGRIKVAFHEYWKEYEQVGIKLEVERDGVPPID